MAIIYANDGIYEIVEPRIFDVSVRCLTVVLLIFDSITKLVFLFNAKLLFSLFFRFMPFFNLLFLAGYLKEEFTSIFLHLVFTVSYTFLVIIFFGFVEMNMKVCNEFSRCQRMSELFESYGISINSSWFYSFILITTITHILMIIFSFKLMRYTAARTELKRLSNIVSREQAELQRL